MPYNNNITSLNFSYEDRLNRDSLTTFPSKFNTTTNITSDMDCITIFGPVTNINCPDEYPDCNCPESFIELRPTFSEPSISELESARNATEECFLIKQEFGAKNGWDENEYVKWGGIDYSNKDSTYNCIGSKEYGKFVWKGVNGGTKLGPLQEVKGITGTDSAYGASEAGLFPYSVRMAFGEEKKAWDIPFRNNNIIDILSTKDKAAANQTIYPVLVGKNFQYYLEYSKTYATFWNTPQKTPLYRKAQTALLKYQRIKILVNGNFDIKPGKIVYINIPITNTPARDNSAVKSRYEGTWMVYRAERIIRPGKHSMYLYLMRDYPSVSPDTQSENIWINVSST
jgi:hypothetical protein